MYEGLKSDYDRYHGPVAPYADELAGELKNFLAENTRPKFQRQTFASGRKLDMRSAMQAEARYERTGEFDPNIWLRRNNPTERGYEFVFVLDESRLRMKDDKKWRNAVQALVLAAEALDQLDIGFGLVGFSDMPKVHKDLSEKFTLESRNSMLADIESSPSGGTNDSDAVKSAIEMLRKGDPDKRKIMIVITDGQGKEDQLKAELARAKELGINAIGVGIDSGMDHVENINAPEAVLVDRISKLPRVCRGHCASRSSPETTPPPGPGPSRTRDSLDVRRCAPGAPSRECRPWTTARVASSPLRQGKRPGREWMTRRQCSGGHGSTRAGLDFQGSLHEELLEEAEQVPAGPAGQRHQEDPAGGKQVLDRPSDLLWLQREGESRWTTWRPGQVWATHSKTVVSGRPSPRMAPGSSGGRRAEGNPGFSSGLSRGSEWGRSSRSSQSFSMGSWEPRAVSVQGLRAWAGQPRVR